MKIAVLGTGNVGQALGEAFARASHDIVFGARDPASEKARAAAAAGIPVLGTHEALREAELVVVTLPAAAVSELVKNAPLAGKVIVDATNTVGPLTGGTAFQELQNISQARVVKCFNSTGFENMRRPVYGSTRADMFMAGDDAHAKAMVGELARDAGFGECHDVGDAAAAPLLEKLAVLWITLSRGELGRDFAFKVLRR